MPPKVTIAYGKSFHFFREAHESNYVYLELEDTPYEVGYRRVMIAIPVDVWETIRGLAPLSFDLVNASDADLIEMVERRVSERAKRYEKARLSSPEEADLIRFDNSTAFGPADDPNEEQIARGIYHYKTERERQRTIVIRMSQHKIIEINAESSVNDLKST
jgi:hypothetical protein